MTISESKQSASVIVSDRDNFNDKFNFDRTDDIPDGVGQLGVSFGPRNRALLSKMLAFRTDFVKRRGWVPEHVQSDVDDYDSLAGTLHLSLDDRDTGHIIAALRVTPVNSVEESLSWSMLRGQPAMMLQANEHRATEGARTLRALDNKARRGLLWDITRLVNEEGPDADAAKVAGAMIELFGVGYGIILRQSPAHEHPHIRFLFTGTRSIKLALNRFGVELTVLALGRIQEADPEDSYFCMVDPEIVMRRLFDPGQNFTFARKHFSDGLKKGYAI